MERVSKLEDRSIGTKTQDKWSLTNLWDSIKMSNKYIIGIPEREERVTEAEKRIKSEQHPKCNEKHQFTNPRGSVNIKEDKCKTIPMQVPIELFNTKDKKKYIKQPPQNDTLHRCKNADFSLKAVGAG